MTIATLKVKTKPLVVTTTQPHLFALTRLTQLTGDATSYSL